MSKQGRHAVPQEQKLAHARARRAANNNCNKQLKTLYAKLGKIHRVYNAEIYLIVRRNGRTIECLSADATGRPWSPPDRNALVSAWRVSLTATNSIKDRQYPPPVTILLPLSDGHSKTPPQTSAQFEPHGSPATTTIATLLDQ